MKATILLLATALFTSQQAMASECQNAEESANIAAYVALENQATLKELHYEVTEIHKLLIELMGK